MSDVPLYFLLTISFWGGDIPVTEVSHGAIFKDEKSCMRLRDEKRDESFSKTNELHHITKVRLEGRLYACQLVDGKLLLERLERAMEM